MRNAEWKTRTRRRVLLGCLYSAFCILTFALPASAQLTQEDVFKSIQTNVGGENHAGSGKGFLVLLGAVGALLLIMLIGSRLNRRQTELKAFDHPGKLLREVMKSVPLNAKELKQLKLLAEESQTSNTGDSVQSPLTFLLCPSVLGRAIKNHPAKIDRVVMTQIVRKMGVTPTPAKR